MRKFLILVVSLLLIVGCNETDIIDETGKLEIVEMNLPELPDGYFYEGWLLVDGSYVSVGKVNNDSLIQNRAHFERIDRSDLDRAQSFAMTVEKATGAPSDYVLLTGEFEGKTADLLTMGDNPNGVLTLSQRIYGGFTVQNASVPAEDAGMYGVNGIWFFKGNEEKEATLNLDYQELAYQAWAVKKQNNADWFLNIGVIKSDTIADNYRSFIPAPYVPNIPHFPGEDFIQQPGEGTSFPDGFFPTDIRGGKVIITPIFDGYTNIEVPFPIVLLQGNIPENAVKDENLVYELELNHNFSAKARKLE